VRLQEERPVVQRILCMRKAEKSYTVIANKINEKRNQMLTWTPSRSR